MKAAAGAVVFAAGLSVENSLTLFCRNQQRVFSALRCFGERHGKTLHPLSAIQ